MAKDVQLIRHNISAITGFLGDPTDNSSEGLVKLQGMVQSRFGVIQSSMQKVEEVMERQERSVWVITVAVIGTALSSAGATGLLFRYSSKIREMVEAIKSKLQMYDGMPKAVMDETTRRMKEMELRVKEMMKKKRKSKDSDSDVEQEGRPETPMSCEMRKRNLERLRAAWIRNREILAPAPGELREARTKLREMSLTRPVTPDRKKKEELIENPPRSKSLRTIPRSPVIRLGVERTKGETQRCVTSSDEEEVTAKVEGFCQDRKIQ
jgi:multidrug efflux pump subunit AcrB